MQDSEAQTAIFGACVFGGAKFDRQLERWFNKLPFIVLFIFLFTNNRIISVVFLLQTSQIILHFSNQFHVLVTNFVL